ncbi:cyclodeaminase/cyclohydrolase family protein [Tepidibacter mesophilus]|uniref:cyclodeaminase/cyclohydrolase family protein n=1 Tax=Tepidibacter mesophilus TaxID=655607 RepID=UPI000C0741CA|nr:cyclodeaminase/cyclohydrolase family protein [Tepidibacter mesophilus]
MKLIDMKVVDFTNEVDSSSPAPGGGSVAALASNIGISLGRMMGNLSFGKKKFEALDDNIKEEFKEKFKKLGLIRDNLLELVDRDTESFNEVMKAFKLPKETDEEKSIRKKAIQDATIQSIDVPFETAKNSLDALELMEYFVDYGNQNAITDLGVGNLLLYTGLEGAILNVKVNLCGLDDGEFVQKKRSECEDMIKKGCKIKDCVLRRIHEKLV